MREEKEDEGGRSVGRSTLSGLLAANAPRPQHTGMCWTQPTGRPDQTQQHTHTQHLIYSIKLAVKGKHLSELHVNTSVKFLKCLLAYFADRLICASGNSHSEALAHDTLNVHKVSLWSD